MPEEVVFGDRKKSYLFTKEKLGLIQISFKPTGVFPLIFMSWAPLGIAKEEKHDARVDQFMRKKREREMPWLGGGKWGKGLSAGPTNTKVVGMLV